MVKIMKIKGLESRYNTLDTYAGIISGTGWIVLLAGVVFLIYGIANKELLGPLFLIPGITGMVLGLVIVANGQLLSCIRSVEENTRATTLLLDRLLLNNELIRPVASASSSDTEVHVEGGQPKDWSCRCGSINSADDELCPSCGRSHNAIV
jgi:hypothetical protein